MPLFCFGNGNVGRGRRAVCAVGLTGQWSKHAYDWVEGVVAQAGDVAGRSSGVPVRAGAQVSYANRRSTLLTQKKYQQTAYNLTLWVPVDIKRALEILPGGSNMIIFRLTALREQLNINVAEGLKAKALRSNVMETDD